MLSLIIILPLFSFKIEPPVFVEEGVAVAIVGAMVEQPTEVLDDVDASLKNGFCPEKQTNSVI